jgi:hypothetical protein
MLMVLTDSELEQLYPAPGLDQYHPEVVLASHWRASFRRLCATTYARRRDRMNETRITQSVFDVFSAS